MEPNVMKSRNQHIRVKYVADWHIEFILSAFSSELAIG